MTDNHTPVNVDFSGLSDQGNDLNKANDYIVNDVDKIRKAVGGVYQCESCGADYTARTVWQKFCPTCSAERKRGVLKTKKAKQANA